MRIVVNGWFLDRLATGSGQYLAALVEWLPRVGDAHEFVVVKPSEDTETRRHGDWVTRHDRDATARRGGESSIIHQPYAIRLARTPFDRISVNLAKLWFEQVTFPRACRRLRADVAFVPYWGSPWTAPCPVVVTIHDLIPLLLPKYRGGMLQRAYTWLVSRTARQATAVLTDSEASKHDIMARLGIPAARVHAIHLAADPRCRPATDPDELARVRTKYRLPDGPFLLYLGGFDVRKNVTRMLEAYAQLVRRLTMDNGRWTQRDGRSSIVHRPPTLIIAGKLPATDTAFAPDPRPVATRLGVDDLVYFTGWVDEADKPALYSLARATVFVSEYEGFGLPVLEAMACG